MHSRCDPEVGPAPTPRPSSTPRPGATPIPGEEPVRRALRRLLDFVPGERRRDPRPLLSWPLDPTREGLLVQAVLGELTIRAEREGDALLSVVLVGKSASRDAGKELQPVFDRLLATAREEGRSLALHFERLDYFNSSTIAALVQFIRTAQRAGVSLVVRYDASLKWQAMSFDALRRALRPFEAVDGPTLTFDGGR